MKTHATTTETTVYRILGQSPGQILEWALRDRFTSTLLGMVVFTNLMVVVVPVSLSFFEFSTAKGICQSASLALLLGYASLIWMLISKIRSAKNNSPQSIPGKLTTAITPRFRNTIVALQCLLFSSLLCSTFIMRQQLNLVKLVDPSSYTEYLLSKSAISEKESSSSLLPLIREYFLM